MNQAQREILRWIDIMPTFKMSKEAAQQTVNQIIRDCRIKESGNMTYDYWSKVKIELDQLEEENWYKV